MSLNQTLTEFVGTELSEEVITGDEGSNVEGLSLIHI